MVEKPVRWQGRLELTREGQTVLDEEGFRILAAIRAMGSIADAAESVGRSYAYVWRLLQRASKELGYRLVETTIGGSGFGGAALTAKAKALLDEYDALIRPQGVVLSGRTKKRGRPVDLTVTGSDCPGLRHLLDILQEEADITSEFRAVGSAAGLAALMLREADVAGLHLLDSETGQYNIPFLRRFWLEDRSALVRGYKREQGLIVRRGNPKRIAGMDDLTRRDVRLVNRQRGSGTRILLDRLLSQLAESRSVSSSRLVARIRGYENEVRGHADVMALISAGKADVGVGLRPTGERLDFLPVREEFFDFAVDRDKLKRSEVQSLTRMLSSKRFAESAKVLGIKTTRESGTVVYP